MPTATPLSQWPVAQSPSRIAQPPTASDQSKGVYRAIGYRAHGTHCTAPSPAPTFHRPPSPSPYNPYAPPITTITLSPFTFHSSHPSILCIHPLIHPPSPTLLTLPNLVSHTHSTHRHHIGNNTSAHARNGTDDACRLLGPRRRPVTLFLSLPLCLNHHACAWPTVHLYASINDSAWHCPFRLTRWSVGLFAGGLLSRRRSTPISETSPPIVTITDCADTRLSSSSVPFVRPLSVHTSIINHSHVCSQTLHSLGSLQQNPSSV